MFLNGTLVHSKKHLGHGFFSENPTQQQVVYQKIRESLGKQE
jgi:hypothetical protein